MRPLIRSSLLNTLQSSIPVVTLDAPRGFGKTTLLAQLADATTQPLLAVNPRSDSDAHAAVDTTLDQCSPATAIVVIDNAADRLEVVDRWIDHPAVRTLIVSDRIIPFELRSRIVGYETRTLTASDLRFTHDELVEVCRQTVGEGDAEAVARIIGPITEGWPLAVAQVVVPLAASADPIRQASTFAASGPHFEELTEYCLGPVDPEIGAAMRELAHLNGFTSSCVDALAGPDGATRARQAGVPLLRGEGGWYRLPGPICQTVRANSSLSEEAALAVAPALVATGGVLSGARTLISVGYIDQAAEVLSSMPSSRFDEVNQQTLLGLLQLLKEQAPKNPRLLFQLARVHLNLGNLAEHQAHLRETVAAAEAADDLDLADEARLMLLHLQSFSQPDMVRAELDSMAQRRSDMPMALSVRFEEIQGHLRCQDPDPEVVRSAITTLHRSAANWENLGEPGRAASTHRAVTATAHSHLGRYPEAIKLLEHARQLVWNHPLDRARTAMLTCRMRALAGDLEGLDHQLTEAWALAKSIEVGWVEAYLAWTQMWYHARGGRPAAAVEANTEATQMLAELLEHETGTVFRAESAIALAECGLLDEARHQLSLAQANRASATELEVSMAEAVVAARAGDVETTDACALSLSASPLLPPTRVWRLSMERGIARRRAGDHDGAGDPDEARQLIDEGVSQAGVIGLESLARLLVAQSPDQPTATNHQTATEEGLVAIDLLGDFAVRRGSAPVKLPDGHVTSLVKLLAIAEGPYPVDVVIDFLWPDDDPKLGQRRLKNVVTRARSLLGKSAIERRGPTIALADMVAVDVRSFEGSLRSALASEDHSAERLRQLVATLDMYHGPLLPADLYEDRFELARENVRARALSVLDLTFELDQTVRPSAAWLLDVLLRIAPEDDQRLLRVARHALADNHPSCARAALERAMSAARSLGINLDNNIEDLRFLLETN